MDDEQIICRVCRSGPTITQPLFHPCKCSGSIRFVHQECLLQWLSHSKKKYCELCKYRFVFTPVYRDDMPDNIPYKVLLRQSMPLINFGFSLLFRTLLAILVWLFVIPVLSSWIWRFYFWSGSNVGFISDSSLVASKNDTHQTIIKEESFYSPFKFHWRELLYDCIQGLIITVCVVIMFVAAYLFREWVIQNTRSAPRPLVNEAEQNTMNRLPSLRNSEQENHDENRNEIVVRLEQLRRDLERRRGDHGGNRVDYRDIDITLDHNEVIEYNHNPYATSGSTLSPGLVGYFPLNSNNINTRSRLDDRTSMNSDENDIFVNPPSGVQSPFISWRDYQHQNTPSTESSSQNQVSGSVIRNEASSNHTWRAPDSSVSSSFVERNSYFAEQFLDETILLETNEEEEENDQQLDNIRFPNSEIQHGVRLEDNNNATNNNNDNDNNNATNNNNDNVNNNANNNNNNNNDMAFDIMDDIDGILEAIGLRGNILLLLKNAILMLLMINLCLCIVVWIPYITGRIFITIHPQSILGNTYITKTVHVVFNNTILLIYTNIVNLVQLFLPTSTLTAVNSIKENGLIYLYFIFKSIHIVLLDQTGTGLASFLSDTTYTIDSWEVIKENIFSIFTVISQRWYQCSFYLSRNKNARPGSTKEILRQQTVFLKVLFFILLELLLFPTMCGIFIDISTLPLFTEWTIKSRFHFMLLNPYSALFLHWFIGTGFILQFSVFIALVREGVRPGVLYFMRDSNDPDFHPIQEIVDQPTFLLLKKLFTNAIAYFMLILVGMGLFTLVVSRYSGICPIIWNLNTPISLLPIDLLAVQFLLPILMDYIAPKELFKKNVITWWHIVSRYLRLSSYMFGGRYPEEEGVYVYNNSIIWIVSNSFKKWWHDNNLETRETQENVDPYFFRRDGELVRVPAHDHIYDIAAPENNRHLFVPVQPVHSEEGQNSFLSFQSQNNNIETDTTIVYIPPYFKCRILIFLFLIWLTGSLLICTISVVLLKLGRNLFEKFQTGKENKPIHDLYSFALGAVVMVLLSLLLNVTIQKYQTIKRNDDWKSLKNDIFKKIYKIIKFSYFLFMYGFLIPFLIGILFDLYISMPIKLTHEESIDLYLTLDWAIGITILRLLYSITSIFPIQSLKDKAIQFNWNNLDDLNIYNTTSVNYPEIKILIFRSAYPIFFCGACCIAILVLSKRFIKTWLRHIRDSLYLTGKRLHNLEELVSS
ncbi:uncharacterized protein BX663DRAFT_549940 [Cokeromyces recurvatus]|uniref:uncharacterized protein n=1 Tax=Cokeromyces recurvatus TaxID=90255 RepID=UPI00221F31E1|nr:uncharacterized protein BX663DRAFT_549940 [Cokeromyces recurvatus]KAI7905092.1 hypothetical protein BX663DRAFT_549940 [Cokeromyces recurvatus]